MWDKIKSELASLFSSQNNTIVTGVKSAVLDELTSLKSELAKANTELATAKSALAEKVSALEKLDADLKAANANVETLKGEVEAAKKLAPAQAQQITASQGQPPIHTTPPTAPQGSAATSIKRADFESLSVAEKTKFIRNGGKVTD